MFVDFSLYWVGSANWSFLFQAAVVFIYPTSLSAVFAKELVTRLTVVLNIFKIEFRPAVSILAMRSIPSSENKLLGFWLSC